MQVNDYFARKNDDDLAKELKKRIQDFQKHLETTGRLKLIAEAYTQHYNLKVGNLLTKTGSQGEILRCSANMFRSYVNNIHVLVAQTKPSFKAEAKDSSFESQAQCILGDAVIDDFLQEGGLEAQFIEAPLLAQIYGDVWLEWDWSEEDGHEIAKDPETGAPVYSGYPISKLHNGLNVTRDVNLRDGDAYKWVIVTAWENKWSLAARYPQHAETILSGTTDKKIFADSVYGQIRGSGDKDSDLVEVNRFYHEPLRGVLPQGKEALMINDTIIEALPLTKHYRRKIPVVRMAAGSMEGSALPYSGAWDLLPLCQATQALLSAAVSNAINLALTSIWCQTGSAENLSISQLKGGFTLFESPVMPQPLNLAHNSPEIWNTINQLERIGQLTTGLNSVARGDLAAASNLKSGTALATVLASAVQFQNTLQQRWKSFCEEAVNILLEVVQKNATQPMLISISGSAGRAYQKAFSGTDLVSVRKIRAELQNPILSTQGGKLEVANNLVTQFPQLMDPTKYINVLKTGDISGLENGSFDLNMVLLAESEALKNGKPSKALLLERHDLYIMNAMKLIATPDAKIQDDLVDNVNAYVQDHLDQWAILMANPQWAALVGIAPMPMGNPQQAADPGAGLGPSGTNPSMAAEGQQARPSPLPKNAGPQLQAAYEGSGVGQLASQRAG